MLLCFEFGVYMLKMPFIERRYQIERGAIDSACAIVVGDCDSESAVLLLLITACVQYALVIKISLYR